MTFPKKEAMAARAMQEQERIASEVFNFETVAALIKTAASKGENAVRLSQDYIGDLKKTKACKSLLKKLKEKGYNTEWKEAAEEQRSNGRKTGSFVIGVELYIFWGAMEIRGASPDLSDGSTD